MNNGSGISNRLIYKKCANQRFTGWQNIVLAWLCKVYQPVFGPIKNNVVVYFRLMRKTTRPNICRPISINTIPIDTQSGANRKGFSTTMASLLLAMTRHILLTIGRLFGHLLLQVNVEGKTNVPVNQEPLILIANHFSWFDAPILALFLPFQPAFLVATESQRKWWVRAFIWLFNGIPIWRGQVDRNAFRNAVQALEQGRIIGIFPEGGINPDLAELVARGQVIPELRGNTSRIGAKLVRARTGTALLATMSGARILPVGLLGTEQILSNLYKLRRTPITLRIGPAFGPLQVEPHLTGRARRQQLDALADMMMQQIAVLFPHENRGYYQQVNAEIP